MMNKDENVKLVFTPEQQAELAKSTDKTVEAVDLTVEELEQRITPRTLA